MGGRPQSGADVQRPERPAGRHRRRPGRLLAAAGSTGGEEEGHAQEPRGPERRARLHPILRLREGGAPGRFGARRCC